MNAAWNGGGRAVAAEVSWKFRGLIFLLTSARRASLRVRPGPFEDRNTLVIDLVKHRASTDADDMVKLYIQQLGF